MREILFKAKRIDNGEWIIGYVVFESYPQEPFVRPAILEVNEDGAVKLGSFDENFNYKFVKVIPETLCQYTGLTDKNGNKIWENDIISENDLFWVIKFKHNAFVACDYNFGKVSDEIQFALFEQYKYDWKKKEYISPSSWYEVVGNIFDNLGESK